MMASLAASSAQAQSITSSDGQFTDDYGNTATVRYVLIFNIIGTSLAYSRVFNPSANKLKLNFVVNLDRQS